MFEQRLLEHLVQSCLQTVSSVMVNLFSSSTENHDLQQYEMATDFRPPSAQSLPFMYTTYQSMLSWVGQEHYLVSAGVWGRLE